MRGRAVGWLGRGEGIQWGWMSAVGFWMHGGLAFYRFDAANSMVSMRMRGVDGYALICYCCYFASCAFTHTAEKKAIMKGHMHTTNVVPLNSTRIFPAPQP